MPVINSSCIVHKRLFCEDYRDAMTAKSHTFIVIVIVISVNTQSVTCKYCILYENVISLLYSDGGQQDGSHAAFDRVRPMV